MLPMSPNSIWISYSSRRMSYTSMPARPMSRVWTLSLVVSKSNTESERLVSALAEIRRRYQRDPTGLLSQEYVEPEVAASPQEAFYAEKLSLPLEETRGRVCSEFVMCYPPGIPLLAPGERVTAEILEHIRYAKEKGCSMTGPEDPDLERLNVLA